MTSPSPAAIATPWRVWARANSLGVNFTWKAISEGRLRVRRVGRRMLVLEKDGLAFLESLPSGPLAMPENFRSKFKIAK
jgi:hypothetical protein